MVSVSEIDEGIKGCRHVKPLHAIDRELVRVILARAHLQYNKSLGVFLVVGVGDSYPKVSVVERLDGVFVCDCRRSLSVVRIPDLASCVCEASLWVAFKIGYFKKPKVVHEVTV